MKISTVILDKLTFPGILSHFAIDSTQVLEFSAMNYSKNDVGLEVVNKYTLSITDWFYIVNVFKTSTYE